jgi:hypothetical protein
VYPTAEACGFYSFPQTPNNIDTPKKGNQLQPLHCQQKIVCQSVIMVPLVLGKTTHQKS